MTALLGETASLVSRAVTALLGVRDSLSEAITVSMKEIPSSVLYQYTKSSYYPTRALHEEGMLRVVTNRDGNVLHRGQRKRIPDIIEDLLEIICYESCGE